MVAVVVAIALGGVGVTLAGNDYRLRQEALSIPVSGGALEAVLTLPAEEPARGLVVVVHGDGPVGATHDGLYLPWFEAAADAGFATLTWSKPGVGGSGGDWLDQTMDDRADEVSAAIDWAQRQAAIPNDTIVLWGASQAGWVLPKAAVSRDDIDGIVAVGPAINWLRQGRYNLLAELDHDGATSREREQAIAVSDQTRTLLEQDADYDTYRAATDDPDPMDAGRWSFVSLNYTSDATDDLVAMADKNVPVLLMLGEHDRNVDVTETASTYQDLLGSDVSVEHFDATHSMARPAVEDSEALGLITGILWPRALFADDVLDTYREYLKSLR
ncbi:alpha/beta hydrolase family protein [Isoptericola halotolerans]|uniref:Serine aminopeptidase S33 domain-containing protein n=1 Tax=Isoptericola halotolerans TaxID=300560 RepID=A0ABX2A834_9MICO|nr:hypothetical protein [Isoptericola halotolerans]